MADPSIEERIASLEAEFKAFRSETRRDNAYMKGKLDAIMDKLSETVTRAHCKGRHEKVNERIREIESKTPAIVQMIVLGVVMALVSYLVGQMP